MSPPLDSLTSTKLTPLTPLTQSAAIVPILLFDGGCQTCSAIAAWVRRCATKSDGSHRIIARPIGHDPVEVGQFIAGLNIWDAYAVVHVKMPDGSVKLGGEAVTEVLRCLPMTRWIAWCCDRRIFGIQPAQLVLNLAYHILDDIRPILGCDSCGRAKPWVRPFERLTKWVAGMGHAKVGPTQHLHFKPLPTAPRNPNRE